MSDKIGVGDMVMVVHRCCEAPVHYGKIFTVEEIRLGCAGVCANGHRHVGACAILNSYTDIPLKRAWYERLWDRWYFGGVDHYLRRQNALPVSWLRRIPPLTEPAAVCEEEA